MKNTARNGGRSDNHYTAIGPIQHEPFGTAPSVGVEKTIAPATNRAVAPTFTSNLSAWPAGT